MTIPVLDRDDVAAAVTLAALFEPVRTALVAYSAERTQTIPIGLLRLPADSEVHVKAGYVPGLPVFAVKVATMFAGTAGGPRVNDGAMLVCSCATGEPVAVIRDRKLLTDLRTAAVGGLATDALARRDARVVAVLGTGGQARLQVLAACRMREIERVHVWGRTDARVRELIDRLRPDLPTVELIACSTAETAVRDADIVITATASRRPIVRGTWLSPGQHVTAVGADDLVKQELGTDCYRRADRVVVDSLTLNGTYGDLPPALATLTAAPRELGAVLAGRHPGRVHAQEITIAKHVGIGVEDTAAAAAVLVGRDHERYNLDR